VRSWQHLTNRPLTEGELRYAEAESQTAPYRMDPAGHHLIWRSYPAFPINAIVNSIKEVDGWDVETWLVEEANDDTGYRKSQYHSLARDGVLDPVVIMLDARGFDIGDGWHRIAWCYANGVKTIPAYVGVTDADLTANWYRSHE